MSETDGPESVEFMVERGPKTRTGSKGQKETAFNPHMYGTGTACCLLLSPRVPFSLYRTYSGTCLTWSHLGQRYTVNGDGSLCNVANMQCAQVAAILSKNELHIYTESGCGWLAAIRNTQVQVVITEDCRFFFVKINWTSHLPRE